MHVSDAVMQLSRIGIIPILPLFFNVASLCRITSSSLSFTTAQTMYRALALSVLTKLTVKDGNPTKITKKEILSILFSVFLILEEEKNKKEILVEILMKQIDKDPTKIQFEVVRPVATVPAMPASVAAGLAGALEYPDVPAQWDEDEAPFFVGVSWDPTHTVALCDMEYECPSSF
jgi:hypothetical protein